MPTSEWLNAWLPASSMHHLPPMVCSYLGGSWCGGWVEWFCNTQKMSSNLFHPEQTTMAVYFANCKLCNRQAHLDQCGAAHTCTSWGSNRSVYKTEHHYHTTCFPMLTAILDQLSCNGSVWYPAFLPPTASCQPHTLLQPRMGLSTTVACRCWVSWRARGCADWMVGEDARCVGEWM